LGAPPIPRRGKTPVESLGWVPRPKIKWGRILADLREAGCSCYRVSQEMGVALSTVVYWRQCEDIGYANGRGLLRLHAKYCGAGLTFQREAEADRLY
jgi:hypothetical protein